MAAGLTEELRTSAGRASPGRRCPGRGRCGGCTPSGWYSRSTQLLNSLSPRGRSAQAPPVADRYGVPGQSPRRRAVTSTGSGTARYPPAAEAQSPCQERRRRVVRDDVLGGGSQCLDDDHGVGVLLDLVRSMSYRPSPSAVGHSALRAPAAASRTSRRAAHEPRRRLAPRAVGAVGPTRRHGPPSPPRRRRPRRAAGSSLRCACREAASTPAATPRWRPPTRRSAQPSTRAASAAGPASGAHPGQRSCLVGERSKPGHLGFFQRLQPSLPRSPSVRQDLIEHASQPDADHHEAALRSATSDQARPSDHPRESERQRPAPPARAGTPAARVIGFISRLTASRTPQATSQRRLPLRA